MDIKLEMDFVLQETGIQCISSKCRFSGLHVLASSGVCRSTDWCHINVRGFMKILITGNMGYIGPTVVQRRQTATIVGWIWIFRRMPDRCQPPECRWMNKCLWTMRSVSKEMLQGVTPLYTLPPLSRMILWVLHFEAITCQPSLPFAQLAREAGAGSFGFAPACGWKVAEGRKTEESAVNPHCVRKIQGGGRARSRSLAEAILRSPVCVLLRPVG